MNASFSRVNDVIRRLLQCRRCQVHFEAYEPVHAKERAISLSLKVPCPTKARS